jgi:hypothetical protein
LSLKSAGSLPTIMVLVNRYENFRTSGAGFR